MLKKVIFLQQIGSYFPNSVHGCLKFTIHFPPKTIKIRILKFPSGVTDGSLCFIAFRYVKTHCYLFGPEEVCSTSMVSVFENHALL